MKFFGMELPDKDQIPDRDMPKEKLNMHAIRWMAQVLGPKKWYSVGLTLITIFSTVFSFFSIFISRDLINMAVARDKEGFYRMVGIMVAFSVFSMAVSILASFLTFWCETSLQNSLKERLFSDILKRDYAEVTATHSGEWMNRLTGDTRIIASSLTGILPAIAGSVVSLFGAFFAMTLLDKWLVMMLVPAGFLLIFFTTIIRRIMKRMQKEAREADGKVRVFLQERLASLMIIRTFAAEQPVIKGAHEKLMEFQRIRNRNMLFRTTVGVGYSLITFAGSLFVLAYCSYGLLNGTMGFGDMTALMQLIGKVKAPFSNFSGIVAGYYTMLASTERLMEAELLTEDISRTEDQEKIMEMYKNRFVGIALKDANFTYRPRKRKDGSYSTSLKVLKDINVEVKKGEYVAFTGISGGGKSTILRLFLCLYPLDSGERILYTTDGPEPLTSAWRGLFAYVPQGNHLMTGTLREVICFGDEEKMKQEEKIREALKLACADEFVANLKDGLDTPLGERGSGLSEGQTQRIAIARAIFSEHPILILDEATSSLDGDTEQQLLKNLRAMTDKTVLIVTHRPAALDFCDRQIVIEALDPAEAAAVKEAEAVNDTVEVKLGQGKE